MTDWETRYYEAEANHTEANGMLTAENALLRRALSDGAKWVPVEERLPEVHEQAPGAMGSEVVLAHWPNDWIGLAQYWIDDGMGSWFWVEQDDGSEADADPTHWMPLPKAPK